MLSPIELFRSLRPTDIIWIVIQVEEGGIMGVTQAMCHLSSADGLTSDVVDSHHSTPSGRWNRTSASTATATTTNAFLSKHTVEQMSQDDLDDAISTNNPFAMSSTLSLSSATSLPVGKSVGFESSFPSACHVSSLSPSSDFLNSGWGKMAGFLSCCRIPVMNE